MFDNARNGVQFFKTQPAFKQVKHVFVCKDFIDRRGVWLTMLLKTTKLTNIPISHGCWNSYRPSLQVLYTLHSEHCLHVCPSLPPRDVSTSSTHFILLPTRDCCPCHRYLAHADMNNVNMFCFGLLLLALLCLSNIVIEWLHWVKYVKTEEKIYGSKLSVVI